jgi:methionyl-tRNA formyltransferase
MKIVILTTETLHHTFLVREINKVFQLEMVFVETASVSSPFEVYHSFEREREIYEKKVFFDGEDVSLVDVAPVKHVGSINDSETIRKLSKLRPEIIVVFGTGRIHDSIIRICPDGIINLHGGDPEKYRGLDTHLWAIYNKDFASLITTIHHLNRELDDGKIIMQSSINITPSTLLYQLRRYNTDICIDLTMSAIDMYKRHGYFISRIQREKGRYYSFMPTALKEICVKRFAKYTESLA